MKNFIKQVVVLLVILSPVLLFAQKSADMDTITIKTSAQCDMCKQTIEKAMAYEKGVKKSNLDVATAVLTVEFNTKKTTPEKIRKAISDVGYDADEVPADIEAYKKLSDCCKKGGHK